MRKFFTDFEYEEGIETLTIRDEEAKHILKVLRFKVGDRFIISNYNDQSFESEIINADLKFCVVKLLKQVDITNKSNINITIFQGYPKFDKLELIVQKLTEIGVREIVPVLTKRVNGKVDVRKFKLDRLNKIAKEACKQCGISSIPTINVPIKLESIDLRSLDKYDLIIVPYEKEEMSLKNVLKDKINENIKNIGVFIGPEGGFEDQEIKYIQSLGGKSVSLGKRILRTETASIFISSVLQYEFGDK